MIIWVYLLWRIMAIQSKIVEYFAKLKLAEIQWEIVASDNSKHPFKNTDVIRSLYQLDDTKADQVLQALNQLNHDRTKINIFLKTIAKSYCDMRHSLIQALFQDYKNSNTEELKDHFYKVIARFSKEDMKKAGIYEEFKKISISNNIPHTHS